MPWALFESEFLIIRRMSFLEKWQLTNEFYEFYGNTLFFRVEDFTIFLKSTLHLLKTLLL